MSRLLSLLTILACTASPGVLAQMVTRTTHGDTTFVITRGYGLWGAPQTAREELRIGSDTSALTFGYIECLAGLPGGGVAVFDDKAERGGGEALYIFDRNGHLQRTLGRHGSGPGEFGAFNRGDCLMATPDGTILMLDWSNSRVNRWKIDGTLLPSIPLRIPLPGMPPYFIPAANQSVYIREAFRRTQDQGPNFSDVGAYGFIRINAAGIILDSVRYHASWLRPSRHRSLDPDEFFRPLADGRSLVTGTDRLAFIIFGTDGKILLAEHPVEPVPVSAAEREEQHAMNKWNYLQTHGQFPDPGVAEWKPATYWLWVDVDKRVWFWRHTQSTSGPPHPWLPGTFPNPMPVLRQVEPTLFSAFRDDGTYLGDVALPKIGAHYLGNIGIRLTFVGDAIWAADQDDDGTPILIKWRIPRFKPN